MQPLVITEPTAMGRVFDDTIREIVQCRVRHGCFGRAEGVALAELDDLEVEFGQNKHAEEAVH